MIYINLDFLTEVAFKVSMKPHIFRMSLVRFSAFPHYAIRLRQNLFPSVDNIWFLYFWNYFQLNKNKTYCLSANSILQYHLIPQLLFFQSCLQHLRLNWLDLITALPLVILFNFIRACSIGITTFSAWKWFAF